MYIIHIVVLYFVLLKLRIDYEIIRNFNMIPVIQTDAKFVTAHIYCAASVWVSLSDAWNRPCACVGIRNEHIPASGRMV